MIIIEKGTSISKLLDKLNLSIGFVKIDQDTLEYVKIGHDELFLIEIDILLSVSEETRQKLLNCFFIIGVGKSNTDLASLYPNLISIIDDDHDQGLLKNKVELLSQTISEIDIMKSQLLSINSELNNVMENLDGQLNQLKSIYEKRLPTRIPKTKGMKLFSKYSAGDSNGGEFFDFYQSENNIFLFMSSTDSYLVSSSILTIFNSLKIKQTISTEDEVNFITEVLSEVDKINLHKERPVSISLFTALIDSRTLEISGHSIGFFNIFTSGTKLNFSPGGYKTNWKVSDYRFESKLQREDKFLIVSPGLGLNLSELSPLTNIEEILNDQSLESIHKLDEIFFQVKKNMDSDFLNHDASAILLEVDKNVMHEI